MPGKDILIRSKERIDREAAADFLRELANKLTAGQVTLHQGGRQVELEVPSRVVMGLKAKRTAKKRGRKHGLTVSLRWVEGEESGQRVTLG